MHSGQCALRREIWQGHFLSSRLCRLKCLFTKLTKAHINSGKNDASQVASLEKQPAYMRCRISAEEPALLELLLAPWLLVEEEGSTQNSAGTSRSKGKSLALGHASKRRIPHDQKLQNIPAKTKKVMNEGELEPRT